MNDACVNYSCMRGYLIDNVWEKLLLTKFAAEAERTYILFSYRSTNRQIPGCKLWDAFI